MCQPTQNIKFCTCKSKSTERLKHYWSWYRLDKEKNEFLIGEVIFPYEFIDPNYKDNHKRYEQRVNENDAFDSNIDCKEGDLFLIVSNNDDFYKRVEYCFEYKKNKWRRVESDVFERMSKYDEVMFGKIKKK